MKKGYRALLNKKEPNCKEVTWSEEAYCYYAEYVNGYSVMYYVCLRTLKCTYTYFEGILDLDTYIDRETHLIDLV